MQYDILLTKQANNGYTAQPILMPEIVISGEDETEVLERVGKAIAVRHAQSRIVRIDATRKDSHWHTRFAHYSYCNKQRCCCNHSQYA